jgi:hypothetical protein
MKQPPQQHKDGMMARWCIRAAFQHKMCSGGGTNETIANLFNGRARGLGVIRGCNNQLFGGEEGRQDTTIILLGENTGRSAPQHNNQQQKQSFAMTNEWWALNKANRTGTRNNQPKKGANPTDLSFCLPSDKLLKNLNLTIQFGYFPQLNLLDGEHH